jgi:uncharacterized membrane protein HdeD (DUF308 family)
MAKKDEAHKSTTSTYRNMSENWKTIVAQGALALVLGVVIVAIPDLSEKVVRYLLGGFLVVYAVLSILSALAASKESEPATWLYIRAVLAGAGGIVILFWPGFTNLTLLYALAVFAIVAGAVIGVTGLMQRWDRGYKFIAGIGGLLSIAWGVILISRASGWKDSVVWMIGVYAMLLGLLLLSLGMGARGAGTET